MEERPVRTRRPAGPPPPTAHKSDVGQEVAGLLLAAAGIWFLLSLAGYGGGALGDILSEGLLALLGKTGAWVASGLCVWFGAFLVYLRFHRRSFEWGRRAWGLTLLLVGFQIVLQLWAYADDPNGGIFENAVNGFGGGLVGYGFAVPLTTIFGQAGRYVALVAALLVGLVLNTDLTLGGAVNWAKERLFDGARGARGAAGDFYELVKNRPARTAQEPATAAADSDSLHRRRKAASEDLNTFEPKIRGAAPAEAPEPAIRRSDLPVIAVPPVENPSVDLANRASRSVKAAAEKPKKPQEEVLPAKLVPDTKGQLGLDPDVLGNAYRLPALEMLPKPPKKPATDKQDHLARAELLERTLRTFGVEARVVEISPGPAVTRYELQPGEGVRVNKFT
ncbi:MAG TPA: DNA translocase FtsK 4TM domain-containing protein, partial [Symbiobacteriaceae bacterium]|nr:DNA translocase FtsK 4TM domain-containing protein [Symbiobacteriaceae bacterium]